MAAQTRSRGRGGAAPERRIAGASAAAACIGRLAARLLAPLHRTSPPIGEAVEIGPEDIGQDEIGRSPSSHDAPLPGPRSDDPPFQGVGATAAASAPSEPEALSPAASPPLRVLAAEDNAANRMVLSMIMEVFGMSVEIVDDGHEAVEAWRRGAFDLILMDVQMPGMNGVDAARAIRAAEAAEGRARTPIIALSANAMHDQVRAYLAADMDAHVAKPIQLSRLHAAIRTAVQSKPATQALKAG